MEEKVMLNVLNKIQWLIIRNRFFEARRLVKQELENLKGITENVCKVHKMNVEGCKSCTNYNCNLNKNGIDDYTY